MHITQDETERLLRVVESYEALTRILLDRLAATRSESYLGTMEEIQTRVVQDRFQQYDGKMAPAAHSLGIVRQTFARYLRRPELTLVDEALAKGA